MAGKLESRITYLEMTEPPTAPPPPAVVHDPQVDVYVLYAGGAPAGYGELDRRLPMSRRPVQNAVYDSISGPGSG